MTLKFYVSGVFETVGDKFGINIGCDGMDTDQCYGLIISSQQTVTQFLTKHKSMYNFLLLDDILDGVPTIRLIRRAVNSDLLIDAVVKQKDCINQGSGAPTIVFTRVDPMSLPRSVELQYISFDRNFAVNTQYAFNEGARTQQAILSVQSDFILDDATARELAYDLLFRMWSQQLTISFEHPDLTIEPADIVQIETDLGIYVVQILTSMITKEPMSTSGMGRTNQLSGQLLLTRKGVTINPGQVIDTSPIGSFRLSNTPTIIFLGDPVTTGGGGGDTIIIDTDWATYNYVSGDAAASDPPAATAQTFWAEIEPFNVGSMVRGVDYTSSLEIDPSTFPNGITNTWSYPEITASGHVYGADLLQFGAYYNGSPWHNEIIPCQIKNLTSWTVTHNLSYTGESAYFDTIYDFYTWVSGAATSSILHEFSITCHAQDYEAAMVAGLSSGLKHNFTDPQGRTWILYCLSGPGVGHQYVFTRSPAADTLTGTLDLRAFINFAVSVGWLSADEYVTGTGLACEVAQGFGTFTVNSISFVYNGVTYQR